MQSRIALVTSMLAVCLAFGLCATTRETTPTSSLGPVEELVEKGCVIEFSSHRTRVDIPDEIPCGEVRSALNRLPRLAEIRLGFGGRDSDAPIIKSYEWNYEAAKQAIDEYRRAFPNVRLRFAPGAF